MRGANMSGSQKAAPYLDDKTPADYAALRAVWGFNSIRFVMTWAAVEPERGVYDDAYLDRVAERMAWARDAGLAVVLDMHQDIYGEGFGFDGAPRWTCDESRYAAFVPRDPWFLNASDPNVIACIDEFFASPDLRAEFTGAWRHVAERLASEPAVIGFDVLNEPNWGSYPVTMFESDRLAPLYVDVVAAVRASAPHWVAFLEPSASRNLGFATGLDAFSFGDVMYAPHSYDSAAESGAGFDPTHRQLILDNVSDLAEEAHALDAGLWIGEYGGMASSPGITEYMTAQYDAAGGYAASTMYWAADKGGDYSLFDPDGTPRETLLDVLVRPYPERVAGKPISYSFDGTFTMTFTPEASITAPTIIIVPSRVFPAPVIDCDCDYTLDGDQLIVTAARASGGNATLTIR